MNEASVSRGSCLFGTCFAAIMATSFCFVLRALVIDDWGVEFALSETQKGELLGVGLWPFALTIVCLSMVIDRIGFRTTFVLAAICHVVGLSILLFADGYWSLWTGTFVMALGNGAVEASANPAVATIYSHDKPRWLNRVHAAWPAGLILGGVLAIGLGAETGWRIKVALMALPIAVYAVMLIRARFPVSERVASGVSYREMMAEVGYLSALVIIALVMMEVGRLVGLSGTIVIAAIAALTAAFAWYARSAGRPIYIILVLLMIPLATTELSTDSWISSLMAPQMEALGLQAGWVLVYTSAIVFVLRIFAGPILVLFTPLGTLALASAAAAVGLYLLSSSSGLALLAAATLYGAGKSFFWGTTLGVVGDQAPKGGAVALNVVAGAGMLAAGIVGSSLLGYIQDQSTARSIRAMSISATYLVEKRSVLGTYQALDLTAVAAAPAADRTRVDAIVATSKRAALRDVALLPLIMLLAYVALILTFRRKGGYRPVILAANPAA